MKVYIKLLLIALLTVVFAFTLAACGGNGNIQADEYYVEVTGVRVPSAVVYLSPDGETSSYQLEPTVFPKMPRIESFCTMFPPTTLNISMCLRTV